MKNDIGLGISDLVDTVSKKRKSVFATSKAIVGSLEYIHKHFLDKFDMKHIKKEADKR